MQHLLYRPVYRLPGAIPAKHSGPRLGKERN
jgi:hypothetical protein